MKSLASSFYYSWFSAKLPFQHAMRILPLTPWWKSKPKHAKIYTKQASVHRVLGRCSTHTHAYSSVCNANETNSQDAAVAFVRTRRGKKMWFHGVPRERLFREKGTGSQLSMAGSKWHAVHEAEKKCRRQRRRDTGCMQPCQSLSHVE